MTDWFSLLAGIGGGVLTSIATLYATQKLLVQLRGEKHLRRIVSESRVQFARDVKRRRREMHLENQRHMIESRLKELEILSKVLQEEASALKREERLAILEALNQQSELGRRSYIQKILMGSKRKKEEREGNWRVMHKV